MDLNIDRNLLNKKNTSLEELFTKIFTGKAILFTGAGFSIKTKNLINKEPLFAKDLAKEICKLGKFDEDDDLRFAADYFIENNDKNKLIDLLKNIYSLSDVSKIHTDICSINWRRFYTTNYDKSIEIASAKIGKNVECIDLHYKPDQYYKRENLCIHLNGSIDILTEDSLEKNFKLSTSSYISPESFITSNWFYHFKRDLERSNAIIFAGYSLYDIEIQKILFENEFLKEKIYFITQENPDKKLLFTLSKFGNVIPIGIEEFADQLSKKKIQSNNNKVDNDYLESFLEYNISYSSETIRDSHVEKMLMYGEIKQSLIDSAVLGYQRIPYLIIRSQLEIILDFSKSNKNIIILGEFGNGKSIFLNEILPYLSVNSFSIHTLEDRDGDYISDIEKLSKKMTRSIITLDGYENNIDLIQYVSSIKPSNITIIMTARTNEHEKFRLKLKEIGFIYNELNIDYLKEEEIKTFIGIFNNMGLWGEKAAWTEAKKMDYLKCDHDMQISLILLDLFNSPHIKDKISKIISSVLENKKFKDTIFSICLLEILGLPAEYSLISELAFNDEIYSSDLRNNSQFNQLFKIKGSKISSKSSLFCLSLVINHFNQNYVITQLHKIAKKYSDHKGFKENRIFKSTLRFSFIERLFSESNKKNNLHRYYQELKISIPWLTHDPHFWLQYGMANIPFKEYGKAQTFFDQAYALARKKYDYYTKDIDTQQARLFILVAIDSNNSKDIGELFKKAHHLLSRLENDIYKFRQVSKYRDFFESCYEYLSKKDKEYFASACKKMLTDIKNAAESGEVNSTAHTIQKSRENLDIISQKLSRTQ